MSTSTVNLTNETRDKTKTVLDINKVDFDKLTIVKSGRTVKLLYDNKPFQFLTSCLYTPFGLSSVKKEWSMFEDFSISCSLRLSEEKVAFEKFINDLDERVKILVNDNLSILDPKGVYTQVDFLSSLKQNGNYPKLIKLQFVRDKNGNVESFIFDEDKKSVWVDETNIDELITKGKCFRCAIECSKIWLYNGKVGIIWNINQLKFERSTNNYTPDTFEEPEEVSNKNLYNKLLINDDDD